MKKCVNGQFFEMTEAEIAEIEEMRASEILPDPAPTADERMDAIEMALLAIMEG